MNLARCSATALVAALVVAGATPAAAFADRNTRSDTRGDVVAANSDGHTTGREPGYAEGDILRSAVVHGPRRVTMAVSLRDLTTSPGAGYDEVHFFRIGTRTKVRELTIVAGPGHWQGIADFRKGTGRHAACRGLRWTIDYPHHLVRASVPRRCLGRPAWVRVGIGEATVEDPGYRGVVAGAPLYADDANTDGYVGDDPKWGPRVHR